MVQETQKMASISNTLTLFERRRAPNSQKLSRHLPKRPELELFAIEAFTA
jgi:hypothetical protein